MKTMSKKINSMVLIIAVPFLMGLGVDMYVPSLPKVAAYFHTSAAFVEWSVGLYMLGYGLGQLLFGPLSDYIGRKKVMLISAAAFCITSILIALSPNIFSLNLFRFLQGFSIAGLAVAVRALLADVFTSTELKKATTYFSISWSIGPILGPLIGAHLQNLFGWKSNFYLFAIYSFIVLIYVAKVFEETCLVRSKHTPKEIVKTMGSMLTHKRFIYCVAISAIMYVLTVLFNVVGPFIIESVMGKSVVFYGNITMILGSAYFIGVIINRILVTKVHEKVLIMTGLFANLGLTIIMLIANLFIRDVLTLIVPVYLMFLFVAFITPNVTALAMGTFTENKGIASSVFGVINGGLVFVITNSVSFLNVKSGIAVAIIYGILILVSIILRFRTPKEVALA
ncbi:MAG: Bcr/CflA family efflux MFS transporter [Sarcina sp.]